MTKPSNTFILPILFFLYTLVITTHATFYFYHGWSHAESQRARSAANAEKCRNDADLMAGHYEQCMHDEADSKMNPIWFGWREVAEHATFCPPRSCAEALSSAAAAIGIVGLYAVAAVGSFLASVWLLSFFFGSMRMRGSAAGGYLEARDPDPEIANFEHRGVRHRRLAQIELADE